MNSFKLFLQKAVIQTSSLWPLSYLYKSYYSLTLSLCIAIFKRFPEVVSIYLVGGYAAGEVVYGLSDIDLIFFTQNNKARVEKIYRLVGLFFPLLAVGEPAVYDKIEVEQYLQSSSDITDLFLSYRLSSDRQRSRLIYGEDIIKETSPQVSQPIKLGFLSQIWSVLINKLIICRTEGVSLGYVCLKLRRQLGSGEPMPPANQIARAGLAEAEQTYEWCTEKIKSLAGDLTAKESTAAEDIGLSYVESSEILVSPSNKQNLKNFVEQVAQKFSKKISSILISPVSFLALEEDRLGVFIVEREPLKLQDVRALKSLLAEPAGGQILELYILNQNVALSLQWAGSDWWHPSPLLSPITEPLTFLHLQKPQSTIFGRPLELSPLQKNILQASLAKVLKRTVKVEKFKKLQYVSHNNLVRLSAMDFQHLFWQALQIRTAETEQKIICSSYELAQHWQKKTGLSWLSELQQGLVADWANKPTATEKLYSQAIELLSQLYSQASEAV